MWYVPENDVMRVVPFVIVAGVCLWGFISPRTQWRALWGWQARYRHVEERDRAAHVRARLIIPFVVSVVAGTVLWFA